MFAQKCLWLREDLACLEDLKIHRWLDVSSFELHGLSDVFQLTMLAVIYLKVNGSDESVNLVCSKTKVAPLKPLTMPRLKLSAVVLLAKLVRYVRSLYSLGSVLIHLGGRSM